jgi:hypothetical protein
MTLCGELKRMARKMLQGARTSYDSKHKTFHVPYLEASQVGFSLQDVTFFSIRWVTLRI